MNLDGITLHSITNELVSLLQGAPFPKYINSTPGPVLPHIQ